LATAIDKAMLSVNSWQGLPLFLKLLFYKDAALLLMLGDALVAARPGSPCSDLCSRGKEPNAVYGDVFDAFVKRSLHIAFPGQCSTPAHVSPSGSHFSYRLESSL
jgi:hypothetical protein